MEEYEKNPLKQVHNTKNVFLHPLSFPEPQLKDLSHFLDSSRDTPIVCLFPTCSQVFGGAGVARCPQKALDSPVDGRIKYESSLGDNGAKLGMHTVLEDGVKPKANLDVSEGVTNPNHSEGVKARTNPDDSKGAKPLAISQDSDDGIKAKTESVLQFGAKDEWMRHLFSTHKTVIDKVNEISSLRSYSMYWRARLSQAPITEFAAVIRTNSTNDDRYDPSDQYYLLSDVFPEERQLREHLQQKKLEAVLLIQQKEREDHTFSRTCLFCSHVFSGNRSVLFQHMLETHTFNVGQPDNLVFVSDFLDLLQQKLDNLQCLYCERFFPDYQTLKDHMRKKQHKKINGQNHAYDRFYVINYLELGKSWEEVQAEDDREILPQVEESEWSDWQEENNGVLIFCLFCPHSSKDLPSTLDHMSSAHDYHYHDVCRKHNLDYYGQVKVINYIRRQIHMYSCCHCKEQCHSQEELTRHMHGLGHCMLPLDESTWNKAQYFFPTFENDAFLFALDDAS